MKLFYCPGACSLAPHIVLEEAGLGFTLERVDLKTRRTESGEDFLTINSKGYVPALQLENGKLLTEGAVISQYLADLKPETQLIPAAGESRYQLLEWMTFISTELHKNMGALYNPALSADWRAAVTATLTKRIDWLAAALGDKSGLQGAGFTIADAYLFTVLNWSGHVGFSLDKWPTLQAYRANIARRPAVIRAMKAEGLI
ncbi:glutathione transferase GstA [Pantoea sp. B65]|uniref:glutathione transferase GstA n=1 Tax=Pantoea sp. B65 TaxID=2813359 RepID=UPI0039B4C530